MLYICSSEHDIYGAELGILGYNSTVVSCFPQLYSISSAVNFYLQILSMFTALGVTFPAMISYLLRWTLHLKRLDFVSMALNII